MTQQRDGSSSETYGKEPRNPLERLLGHAPALVQGLALIDQTIGSVDSLGSRLAELAFLRASVLNGCSACVRKHAASARRQGLSEALVARLLTNDPPSDPLASAQDRAVIEFTDLLTQTPEVVDQKAFDAAREHLTEDQIVELVLVVSSASALNRIVMSSRYLRMLASASPV